MISIIVPVYNEGDIIGRFLDEVETKVITPHDIVIVHDSPDDNTIAAVAAYRDKHPRTSSSVRLIQNNICRGPSGAIRTGFNSSTGNPVVVSMADLSDDMSQIDHMVELSNQGFDVVCPSRYCAGGRQDLHTIKAWIPRWVGKILRLLTNIGTHDLTNSYRLYTRRVLDSMHLTSTHSFSVTLEITAKAFCLDFKIVEFPTEWKIREVGKSKFPFLASLGTYLPWFFLSLTANRFIPVPLFIRNKLLRHDR